MRALSLLLLVVTLCVCCSGRDETMAKRGYNQTEIGELNESDQYDYDRVAESPENPPQANFLIRILNFLIRLFSSAFGYLVIIGLVVLLIIIISVFFSSL